MGIVKQVLLGYLGWSGREAGKINQRRDRAADDVPIANRNWDHWLDVEDVYCGIVLRSGTTVDVILKR